MICRSLCDQDIPKTDDRIQLKTWAVIGPQALTKAPGEYILRKVAKNRIFGTSSKKYNYSSYTSMFPGLFNIYTIWYTPIERSYRSLYL